MVEIEGIDAIECDLEEEDHQRFWKCTAFHYPPGEEERQTEFYAQGFEQIPATMSSRVDGRYADHDLKLIPFPDTQTFTTCYHKDGVTGDLEKRQPLICEPEAE